MAALAILSVEASSRFRITSAFAYGGRGRAFLAAPELGCPNRPRAASSRRARGFWSSAVDEVRRYVQSHSVHPDRLKILNWGFLHNLYVGSGGSVYGSELFWGATRERSTRGLAWESEILDGGEFLLYVFPTGSPALDAAAEGFSRALKECRGPQQGKTLLRPIGVFRRPARRDPDGALSRCPSGEVASSYSTRTSSSAVSIGGRGTVEMKPYGRPSEIVASEEESCRKTS